jgi:Protein of unknown function (DUF1236)
MRNDLLAAVALSALIGSGALAASDNGPEGQPGEGALHRNGAQPQLRSPNNGPRSVQTEAPRGAQTGQSPVPEKIEPKGDIPKGLSGGPGAPPAGKAEPQRDPGSAAENDQDRRERAGEAEAPGGKSDRLSDDQRAKLKGFIDRGRVASRVDHLGFTVRVGTVVPHDVRVTLLPAEIVEFVPQYRGYDYVLVGDELLIVDPHSLEIVAILEA